MNAKSGLEQVLAIVRAGHFEKLKGYVEDDQVECKSAPYQLSGDDQRFELAKDVTSLANAKGGVILIGVQTEKDEELSADVVNGVSPFEKTLLNISQYRDILAHWVYPGLQKLKIEWIPSASNQNLGIVVIDVGNQDQMWRPFLVTKATKDNGKASSVIFAYAERNLDRSAPMGVQQLHLLLRDGLRIGGTPSEWTPLSSKMSDESGPLFSPDSTASTPNSKLASTAADGSDNAASEGLKLRISKATKAVLLTDKPVFTLAAAPCQLTDIEDLFTSRNVEVVRLLENPPELRAHGFGVGAGYNSRIVEQGMARRTVIEGYKLLEFWKDGAIVFIATGGPDFLSWASRAEDLLRVNQLTLIEATVVFTRLVKEVLSRHSRPFPKKVSFRLEVRRMTVKKPAILFPDALCNFPHGHQEAPSPDKEVSLTIPLDTDPQIVAFKLISEVYHWFAFDDEKIPYTEEALPGVRKISEAQIIQATKRLM